MCIHKSNVFHDFYLVFLIQMANSTGYFSSPLFEAELLFVLPIFISRQLSKIESFFTQCIMTEFRTEQVLSSTKAMSHIYLQIFVIYEKV